MENNKNPTEENFEDIPRIRTFQSDIAEAMKNKQGSVVKIAVAEHERKTQEGINNQNTKKSNGFYLFGSIVLLLLLAGGGYYFWQKNKSETITVPTTSKPSVFIQADKTVEIVTSDANNIYAQMKNLYDTQALSVGQVVQVVYTEVGTDNKKKILTLDELLGKLSLQLPENLVRSLSQTQYTFGGYQQTGLSRFIVLKTTAFGNTFASTLDWEKTMFQDMTQLLALSGINEEGGVFVDKIIKNEDTRILYDKNKKAILGYTFFGPKKEMLLITQDEETLGKLIERFTEKTIRQ